MPEYPVTGPSAWPPIHPGELLREETLPALHLSVTDAARTLGISRQTLHAILAERTAVTPAMALRLAKLCGGGPEIWLRMQMAHDLWQAERDLAPELARVPNLHAA